jgi:hypothetical protein
MLFDNQEEKKVKKLLGRKKRKSLKRDSNEISEDYKKRVVDKLSPIQNIFLSGKDIKSIKDIVENWRHISNSPFWKHNYLYTIVENFFYIYLQEKYKRTKGVAIIFGKSKFLIGLTNFINLSLNLTYNKPISTQYRKITTDTNLYKNLDKFLKDPNVNLIVIPFCTRDERGSSGHAVVFMINKYLKTIEYYDSNGSELYTNKKYPKYRYIIDGYYAMREWFLSSDWYIRDGYNFLEVYETNPRYGIQYYGDGSIMDKILPRKFHKIGWCMIYSLMIIHYRIYYYKIDPLLLQKKLLEEISKNRSTSDMGINTVEFLLNYLVYISEKVNQPEFLEKMQKSYPEYFPSMLKKIYIKRHTLPYI